MSAPDYKKTGNQMHSSFLDIEWTNQHACGGTGNQPNMFCQVVIQYMCRPESTEEKDSTRDGDRFWYENTLSEEEITKVEQMSMSRLIKYNSGVHECVDDVFFASKHCQRSSKYQCFPKGICDPRSKPRGFCNPKPTTKPVIPYNKPLQDEHEEKFLVPALIVITCILFIICILVLVVIARQKLCKARNSGPTIDGTVVANFEARTDGQTEVNLPPPYQ